jgi:hypothetical protein
MNVKTLSDGAKHTLWCIGACNQLKEWGLLAGGKVELTIGGQATWDQLDMDFKASDRRIEVFAKFESPPAQREGITEILREFRDNRERMLAFVESENRKP